jgi:hypothetical protein
MDNMTREPCDFVKLVLQRMDSNPEEFEHYGRWNALCEALERYAGAYTGNRSVPDRNVMWAYDQFEVDLMVAKYREIYRDREYKSMLKNLLVGAEPKAEGRLIRNPYPNITPQQLFANGPTNMVTTAGSGGQYAENTTTISASTGLNTVNYNPQLRSQIDDAVEAKMQGFKRG